MSGDFDIDAVVRIVDLLLREVAETTRRETGIPVADALEVGWSLFERGYIHVHSSGHDVLGIRETRTAPERFRLRRKHRMICLRRREMPGGVA